MSGLNFYSLYMKHIMRIIIEPVVKAAMRYQSLTTNISEIKDKSFTCDVNRDDTA